ncbi:MAG TPA: DUF192 domain-containing protein [Actinomycetota bacterium]|nr:DUF192 domain-containing protein [Actinomycetota bacterium]
MPSARVEHDGRVLAGQVAIASSMWARARGLLGRSELARGEALVLPKTKQVHTVGMTFPIDVLFLDENGRVLHLVRAMRPWRLSRWVRRCRNVIELQAGAAADVKRGDRVEIKSP